MGYDSSIILPEKTSLKEVKGFLKILKYNEIEKNYFFYNNNDSEEHFTGVTLHIEKTRPNIEFHLRTTVWTTIVDTEFVNLSLKEISRRFNGYYRTEFGKNKPYKFSGIERRNAEAGCYNIFRTFNNNMCQPNVFFQHLESLEKDKPLSKDMWFINEFHPTSIGMNITVPFLISVFEEYFRSTFIVLLKWSNRKKEILKSLRINSEDLFEVSEGKTTVEKIASRYISFQNIENINSAFNKISKDVNFNHLLKSTNREKDYYNRLEKLIDFRHKIIHSNLTNPFYKISEFKSDLLLISEICEIFYNRLIEVNNWKKEKY
jgi:hypothetical protein